MGGATAGSKPLQNMHNKLALSNDSAQKFRNIPGSGSSIKQGTNRDSS